MNGLYALMLVLVVVGRSSSQDENGIEDVETFEQVEKNFKKSVGSIVKMILPMMMESGTDANVSGPCRSSLMRIIGGVKQLREWAIRFIDASGKLPPGILEGTTFSTGDYDECLAIEVGRRDAPPKTPEDVIFRGQYCLLEAHRPEGINRAIEDYRNGNKDSPIVKTKTFLNMFIRYKHLSNSTFKWGICTPSKCSAEDIQNILNSDNFRSAGRFTVSYCKQNEDEEKSLELILLLCVFGFALSIMIIGTILDTALRLRRTDASWKGNSPYIIYMEQVTRNTSLYTNAIETLSTKTSESIKSLCGIRTIVVVLTIYSHTYGHIHMLHFQKFTKAANFIRFFDSFTFSGIANGSVSVDTMFLIAGITITYNRWRYVSDKSKVNLNIWKLLLERYFRMTFAQILVICICLMFPLYGSGPLWEPYVESELTKCKEGWWKNLLYVNNFFQTSKTCLYHTWILALIMQFTLLSVAIIWILQKSKSFGLFTMIVLVISGVIGVAVVTVSNKLPGSMAFYMLDARTGPITWTDLYIMPFDHVGAFCIGLLTGYILAVKKDKLDLGRCTSMFIWCLSITCSTAVMFGLYSYRHGDQMDQSLSAFYAVMHRNVWALCIAWLIIACTTKHGGALTRVLHSGFFVPTNRLCYMAFLLHIPVMYYHSGIIRDRLYMGHFELLLLALGYIILSFSGSFILHIIFVKPYFAIEDSICKYLQTKRKMSFDPKADVPEKMEVEVTNSSSDATEKSGCVNIAYSKKLDGV